MVRKAVSIKTAVYMDKASRFSVLSKLLMSLREPLRSPPVVYELPTPGWWELFPNVIFNLISSTRKAIRAGCGINLWQLGQV